MIYKFVPNEERNRFQALIFAGDSLVGFVDTERLSQGIAARILQGNEVEFTLSLTKFNEMGLFINRSGGVHIFDYYIMILTDQQMPDEIREYLKENDTAKLNLKTGIFWLDN